MSLTPFRIRQRTRRLLVLALDQLASFLDDPPDDDFDPLDDTQEAPLPDVSEAPPRKPPVEAPSIPDAEAERQAKREERQKAHWAKTRAGVLNFVAEQGGSASLRDMHDHSEAHYFVAHVSFSRLMEELTDEGLLDYDHDDARATLTDAGREAIA